MFRALCILLLAASSMAFRVAQKNAVPFILNGDDADEGEWPHQASLQSYGSHICGASWLSGEWVVTAAHCVSGSSPNSLSIVLGVHKLSDATRNNVYEIDQIFSHPDYNPYTLRNDHALLQLNTIPSGDAVDTVFADDADEQDNWVRAECWITGWGQNDNGIIPDVLQEAEVLALSQEECEEFYSRTPYDIYDDMICVGHNNDDYTGACYGDSGGPFVCRHNPSDAWTLVGVTSWAYPPCGNDYYPSVYSRTAVFRDWISETCGGCI